MMGLPGTKGEMGIAVPGPTGIKQYIYIFFHFSGRHQTISGKHVRAVYTPSYPILFLYRKNGVYIFFLFLLQNIDCG